MRYFLCAVLAALLTGLGDPALAGEAVSPGHENWNGWSFDYEMTDDAGLVLKDVDFKGTNILSKASLPVIRVQYDGNATGPWADNIVNDPSCSLEVGSIRCLLKILNCGSVFLCKRSFTVNGVDWLEMSVLARVGDYRINQAWFFAEDGSLDARLFSRGIAKPVDHRHHPYWQFDFDVVDNTNEVWVFEDDGPAIKEGNQIFFKKAAPPHKLTIEGIGKKSENIPFHTQNRRWLVKDPQTQRSVWIIPGENDGRADTFSKADIATRLYHSSQDREWEFGAAGGLGYDNDENIESDVVFWYISHMAHDMGWGTPDGMHWIGSGPRIKVNSPPTITLISPTDGSTYGTGGLNIVSFKATVTDVEDGAKCCILSWKSNKEGALTGQDMAFSSAGERLISVTATDLSGATSTASAKISVGNKAPAVTIVKPTFGQQVYQNSPLQLEGTSFDPNEQFLAVPCNKLKWTSSKPGDPFPITGCFSNATFPTAGSRTVKLVGTDSDGATGQDTVTLNVAVLPADAPPQVVIISPPNNLRPDPMKPLTLKAKATGSQPLQFQWTVEGKPIGNVATMNWIPRDDVPFNCGGESVDVCANVTASNNKKGSACINLTTDDPPC